jgi:hypothetical protein
VHIAAELAGLVQEFGRWSWCYRQGRTVTAIKLAQAEQARVNKEAAAEI